eukprot:COSAG06_NODE_9420_length_1906_cov_2.164361_2_plen_59_part_01
MVAAGSSARLPDFFTSMDSYGPGGEVWPIISGRRAEEGSFNRCPALAGARETENEEGDH